MFDSIEIALEILMLRKNTVYGLDHFKKCLEDMGNPQNKLKCIHIAGTNGKGSTTNYIRAVLQKAGNKVGSFTSPHLMVHNDRIRINDKMISDQVFLKYINDTHDLWEKYELSMFEIDMLISILYFIDEDVDYVVYEVGLGGTLDATNVIDPLVCGITNVDFDHMNILGNTLEAIASQKGGIIKEGKPLFTSETKQEVLDVFKEICHKKSASFNQVLLPEVVVNDGSYHFNVSGVDLVLTHQGRYQVSNASLATGILKSLNINDEDIKVGIENASWAGRFEEIEEHVFLDGAHNILGIKQLIASTQILKRPLVGVFTALGDKSYQEMIDLLEAHFDELIITQFDFYRAAKATDLAKNHKVIIEEDFRKAIDLGRTMKKEGSLVITGSLYFISEARAYLQE